MGGFAIIMAGQFMLAPAVYTTHAKESTEKAEENKILRCKTLKTIEFVALRYKLKVGMQIKTINQGCPNMQNVFKLKNFHSYLRLACASMQKQS